MFQSRDRAEEDVDDPDVPEPRKLVQSKLFFGSQTKPKNPNSSSNSTGNRNIRGRKSIVWNFLEDNESEPKSTIKICTLCRAMINTSNNTSNARTHLKAKHPFEFAKAEKTSSDIVDSGTSDTDSDLNLNNSTSIRRQADGEDDVSSTSISTRSNLDAGTNEEMVLQSNQSAVCVTQTSLKKKERPLKQLSLKKTLQKKQRRRFTDLIPLESRSAASGRARRALHAGGTSKGAAN